MARQIVGGWEQESFDGLRLRREILNQLRLPCRVEEILRPQKTSRFQLACDIKHGFAFAHRERPLVHIAVGDAPEHVLAADRMIEKVFSGLQCALLMAPRVNFKRHGAADDAFLFQ